MLSDKDRLVIESRMYKIKKNYYINYTYVVHVVQSSANKA